MSVARDKWGERQRETWKRKAAELVEDIVFLAHPEGGGVRDPYTLLQRLGYRNQLSLARRLYRHGYPRLASVFERDDFLTREPWELLHDKIAPDLREDDGRDSLQSA